MNNKYHLKWIMSTIIKWLTIHTRTRVMYHWCLCVSYWLVHVFVSNKEIYKRDQQTELSWTVGKVWAMYIIFGERLEMYRYERYHMIIESNLYYSSYLTEDRCYQRVSWYKFKDYKNLEEGRDVFDMYLWNESDLSRDYNSRFMCARRDYLLIVTTYLMHVISLWIQSIDWPLHG